MPGSLTWSALAPIQPLGTLDENELAILAKGPKFLVRDELNASEFNLEVESMVAKKKYDTVFNDKDDLDHVAAWIGLRYTYLIIINS